jgi:hypothetical protein
MNALDSYDACKQAGPELMATLVDRTSQLARFNVLQALNEVLAKDLGFRVVLNQEFGPPGGRQVFYQRGRVVVRVKTRGDKAGPRANKAHLSVGITDGKGLDWTNDLAKFNAEGKIAAKAFTSAEKFKPIDFQGNPQRFIMIQGGANGTTPEEDEKLFDAWANRVHFNFPEPFNDAGAADLA